MGITRHMRLIAAVFACLVVLGTGSLATLAKPGGHQLPHMVQEGTPASPEAQGATPAALEATPIADLTDNVIQITIGEFTIEADQLTLTAGQEYTFVVTNQGQLIHEVVIEPAKSTDEPLEVGDRESEIEDIAPGTSPELTWTFEEPGMYQFACHIPGHYEQGMVLEFEVVAP